MNDKITIYNYEAYFLDDLEGKLTVSEKEELRQFLAVHPHLKLDMDFSGIELVPEQVTFLNKEALKFRDSTSEINAHNVQEGIIAKIEVQLSAVEVQQLEDYIDINELQEMYKLFEATVLQPDLIIKFPAKDALKRKSGRLIPFYVKMMRVAAVGIILLSIGLTIEKMNRFEEVCEPVTANKYVPLVSLFIPAAQKDLAPSSALVATRVNDGKHTERVANSGKSNRVLIEKMDLQKVRRIQQVNLIVQIPLILESELVQVGIAHKELASMPPNVRSEQPYKLLTDAASDVIRRDIAFVRDKNIATSNYVAFRLKIGNVEFERKRGN